MIRTVRGSALPLAFAFLLLFASNPRATSWKDPPCVAQDCSDPGLDEGCTAANSRLSGFQVSHPARVGHPVLTGDKPKSPSRPLLEATPPFTPTDLVFLPYVSKPRPPLGWVRIGPAEGDALLDIDVAPQDSNRLYASTRTGLYRSMDRGATWELALAGFFRQLVIDRQQPSILYTGPSDENWQYGVFKSTDAGNSWTRYSDGMTCDNLAALTISATEPNILFTGSF
jgi:hypothetical protein